MIKILVESLQDVDSFLKNDIKEMLLSEFSAIEKDPGAVGDHEVCEYVVNRVADKFPDDLSPESVSVAVVKVQGDETEILTTGHQVVKFNGYLYDYTAHQFVDEYNGLLTFGQVPVIQQVVTDDSQISDKISTVKFYALVEY